MGSVERDIIKFMYEKRRPVSIKEISEAAEISWVTTRGWLRVLESKGVVRRCGKKKKGKDKIRERWELNYILLDKILG